MNNNFSNPYLQNPYMNNAYFPQPYGSSQNRIAMLEQQKHDIENQISALQSQQGQSNLPPININNQISPNGNTQPQGNFDFNGRFIKNESEIKDVFNNNLPIILMSSEDSKFYIKNLDGSITKYKFEEIAEENENGEKENEKDFKEFENLKQQVKEQQIALNKIVGLLQASFQPDGINNQVIENNAQNVQNEQKTSTKNSKSKKGVK
jgi:hypothetical protein